MTREDFINLPYLLTPGQAAACGYSILTLDKYAANGILVVVRPPGCTLRRFQKRQLAQMAGWEDTLNWTAWRREKPLVSLAAVVQWTGISRNQVRAIVRAGGLTCVQPGGMGEGKYRREELGVWLGFIQSGVETGKAALKSSRTVATRD